MADPDKYLKTFLAANSSNDYKPGNELKITLVEANTLAAGVRAATLGNSLLADAIFKHFTANPLSKMTGGQLTLHDAEEMYTHINIDYTVINSALDLSDPKVTYDVTYTNTHNVQTTLNKHSPKGALGTLLLHEMAHYRDFAQGMYGEAPAYGIEYYFVKRLGLARIPDIMRVGATWNTEGLTERLFCKWALVMKWCHDNIDRKLTVISADDARKCVADFLTDGETMFPTYDRTKALNWAEAELKNIFGDWPRDDRLPGTKEANGSIPYKLEAFKKIQPKIDAAIP